METNSANNADREVAQQVTEAHNLLQTLRSELDQHPRLEEAIAKLESALSILTSKSGGLL